MRSSLKNLTQKLSLNTGLTIPEIFQQKYIPSLNGLRAIAIAFVILDHLRYGHNCPCTVYSFSNYLAVGSFGVQIFFVISGFLITGLLLKEKVQTSTINLKKFYVRRAIRIIPAFYFFLVVMIVLKSINIAHVNNPAIIASFLFVSNFGNFHSQWLVAHTWSLSVEEQFYLLWPLVLIFLPRKYYFVLAGVIIYNLFYYYLRYYHPLFVLRFFLITAPALVTGAALSIALYKGWLKNIHRTLIHPIFALSLAFAAIIYLPRAFKFAPFFYTPFDYILSSLFIGIFIYHAVNCNPKSLLFRVLNFSVINYIGVLSYSIYLWQQPFFASQANYRIYPYWAEFPKNMILILIAALMSYYLIEKPFLRLKKHF
jgi:peptidoglycan/LPS O-acetylase OafA/YrhL